MRVVRYAALKTLVENSPFAKLWGRGWLGGGREGEGERERRGGGFEVALSLGNTSLACLSGTVCSRCMARYGIGSMDPRVDELSPYRPYIQINPQAPLSTRTP